jgi:hypothetical protein
LAARNKLFNMFFSLITFAATGFFTDPIPTDNNTDAIIGHWKGIDMYQDENSYDGKTFYLPNSEEIVIDKNKVRVYFYPYFKSDEFEAMATPKSILYTIGKKKVKSEYVIHGDTLTLSMHFIGKTFIKMYHRVELEQSIIDELDEFGFNPSSVVLEFELDTLHKNLWRGFNHLDSLTFKPVRYIQFMSDNSIRLDRQAAIPFERSYKKIWYADKEVKYEFEIYKIHGSQEISILPKTHCQCDTITFPYIAVSWADRIRKQIIEDTW